MSSRAYVVLAFTMAAPLVYLYLVFLGWLISNRVLPGANYIEVAVFVTQLIRLDLVMSLRRLRTAPFSQIWDIFAVEAFSFPVLLVLYLWYGYPYLLSTALTIMTAWPSALLCVFPVYMIYRLTSSMRRDRRLMSVVPAAVALFTLFAFITRIVSSQPAPSGLSGLSWLLFSSLLKTRSIDVTPEVVLAGIPLYLSLVTYATIQGEGISAGRNSAMLLIIFGTLVSIGLAALSAYIPEYPLLLFGAPGAFLLTMMWWMTRAR